MDPQDMYEKNRYCINCWEDWDNFIYSFTSSSWDVFNCKNCKSYHVIWFKPKF